MLMNKRFLFVCFDLTVVSVGGIFAAEESLIILQEFNDSFTERWNYLIMMDWHFRIHLVCT
jgi:hypothetical protein